MSDVVGAAFQQADAQLTLEPLHSLAQRRLHDVLPGGRAAEMQFLGQGHEIANGDGNACLPAITT